MAFALVLASSWLARNTFAEQSRAETAELPRQREGMMVIIWDDSDRLSSIGSACGITPGDLLGMNNLTVGQLRSGQALRVPVPIQLRPQAPSGIFDSAMQFLGLRIQAGDGQSTMPLPAAFDTRRPAEREIWRGVRGRRKVALTFDAGGDADMAPELLRVLREYRAQATFFVTGQFIKKHPDLLKEIVRDGRPIHNHAWSHPECTKLTDEEIREELAKTEREAQATLGRSTKPYWRPPFGDRNRRVLRAAADAGYQSVYWTIDSLDSYGDQKKADDILNRILHYPRAEGGSGSFLDGAIILMHVGLPESVAVLPLLIQELRARGFDLVTVEDILAP
ncbi:MAG: polysaccharide deacetylase family protein [bacterium]